MVRRKAFTDEEKITIAAMWNAGDTSEVIGAQLKCHGSYVRVTIAKLRRLGWQISDHVAGTKKGSRDAVPRKGRRRPKKPEAAPEPVSEPPKAAPVPIVAALAESTERWVKGILLAGTGRCRFTDEEHNGHFCNELGFPWCDEHIAVVYNKRPALKVINPLTPELKRLHGGE